MPDELSAALKEQVAAAVKILAAGGLVAFPTDTVYGLGAIFNNAAAVARIFTVKQRPLDSALPLVMADESQLEMVSAEVSPLARQLARRFWPGELTLVVAKSAEVPDCLSAGGATVAVRVSSHPVARALAAGLGTPLVGTSANVHGRPSPVTADEVRDQLGDGIEMIIDGGACRYGRESTIIDVSGAVPRIIRPGVVSREELEEVCGEIV